MAELVVYLGIGVPGSGKTTYLKPFAEKIGAVYLSTDDLRQELLGDLLDHSDNQRVWGTLYQRADAAFQGGQSVVIDAMNLDPRWRTDDIKRYRQYCAKVVGLWFNFSLAEVFKRNGSRQQRQPVPESDIEVLFERMNQNPPALTEGFDEIVDLSNVLRQAQDIGHNPSPPNGFDG